MSQLFDLCRRRMLTATLDWAGMECVLLAYSGSYIFDATDMTQDDLGDPTAASGVLINPVVTTAGYAKSDAGIFTEIPVGPPITFLVLAEDNVVPDDRELLAYINVAQNMPFTPNGLDWVVKPDWANSQGWFRA